jgi:hypothetical protein
MGSVPESREHRAWKGLACGCAVGTTTERVLADRRRLDCFSPVERVCGEVAFSRPSIRRDIAKLEAAGRSGLCDVQTLVVRTRDLDYAAAATSGTRIRVREATGASLAYALASCLAERLRSK